MDSHPWAPSSTWMRRSSSAALEARVHASRRRPWRQGLLCFHKEGVHAFLEQVEETSASTMRSRQGAPRHRRHLSYQNGRGQRLDEVEESRTAAGQRGWMRAALLQANSGDGDEDALLL